jgi:hypothetical protein
MQSPLSYFATATGISDDSADIIDVLTMLPEERRRVARLLAEVDADNG